MTTGAKMPDRMRALMRLNKLKLAMMLTDTERALRQSQEALETAEMSLGRLYLALEQRADTDA